MALQNYNGPAGVFQYDTDQFSVSEETGLLSYIGYEIDGRYINIPDGILVIDGMFKDTDLQVAPTIPKSVLSMKEAFSGCRNLRHFPNIPPTIVNMDHAFSNISTNDIAVTKDKMEETILDEMQQSFDYIEYNYEKEVQKIQETFFDTDRSTPEKDKKALDKANKEIINSQLRAELAICRANLDGLEKMQNNLVFRIAEQRDMWAPGDYMKIALDNKAAQIEQVKLEMDFLEKELRYRNPTALDIAQAKAIKAKEWLISVGQKSIEKITDHIQKLKESTKVVKGNIFRAAELAQAKTDLKINKLWMNISKQNLEHTINVYGKLVPAVAEASKNLNNIKESLSALRAGMKGEEYSTQIGLTESGKELIRSMYATVEGKMINSINAQKEYEMQKLAVDWREPNLSTTERRQAIEFINNAKEMIKEASQQIKETVEEDLAYYEQIKDARENGDTQIYQQEMTAEEMAGAYSKNIQMAQDMQPAPSETKERSRKRQARSTVSLDDKTAFIEGYLFSETETAREDFSKDEFDQKVEEILYSTSFDPNHEVENWIAAAEERGVHIKEDHATILTASMGDAAAPHRKTFMDSEQAKDIVEKAKGNKNIGSGARSEMDDVGMDIK